jgi:hypothetical protein
MNRQEDKMEPDNENSISQNPKRKRIPLQKSTASVIDDPLAFIPNKSSIKAKKIFTEVENITVELWFDKHYHDRDQHGDDFGKRDGITNDIVENLVKRSIKHMVLYCSLIKGFHFLNRNLQPHERPLRIILQEDSSFGLLNVIIEAHFLNINRYEITVKTAMCKDDFKLNDNQYAIQLDGEGSILKKCDLKRVMEVCSVNLEV